MFTRVSFPREKVQDKWMHDVIIYPISAWTNSRYGVQSLTRILLLLCCLFHLYSFHIFVEYACLLTLLQSINIQYDAEYSDNHQITINALKVVFGFDYFYSFFPLPCFYLTS